MDPFFGEFRINRKVLLLRDLVVVLFRRVLQLVPRRRRVWGCFVFTLMSVTSVPNSKGEENTALRDQSPRTVILLVVNVYHHHHRDYIVRPNYCCRLPAVAAMSKNSVWAKISIKL